MKKFTVQRNSTLRDFTDDTYPQGSFAFAALLRVGDIRINGVKVNKNTPVKVGDEVTYYTTKVQESKQSFLSVYEDDQVLVADKFSGVSFDGLINELSEKGKYYGVHRLDRNTSGLIVFAKTMGAEEELCAAFKDKDVQKTYLCFAKNAFKKRSDVLTAYLKKDERQSIVFISDTPKSGFVKIVTEYEVVQAFGDYALVKIILHTGRTHQIRAHLAHIGCPVLGDEKYGDQVLNKKYNAKRQILISHNLKFALSGSLSYLNDKKFESSFYPQLPKN